MFLAATLFFAVSSSSFASDEVTIRLRNGQVLTGKIIVLEYDAIGVYFSSGKRASYFAPEIDSINGLKLGDYIESLRPNNAVKTDANDFKEEQLFQTEMRNAFTSGNFSKLDSVYEELVKVKTKMLSGRSKLDIFYRALCTSTGRGETAHLEMLKKVEAWLKSFPASQAAATLLIKAHEALAWDYRGNGYSNTISQTGLKRFQEAMETLGKMCREATAGNSQDPELYAICMEVGTASDAAEDEMLGLLHKGMKLDPSYYPLYINMSAYYLPRWGGKPADLENFADRIHQETQALNGYANYVWIVDWVRSIGTGELPQHTFSWDRLKAGFEEMRGKYPKSFYLLNSYCWLAVYYKDKSLAASLFAQIGKRWDSFSVNVWGTSENFEEKRKWVFGGDVSVVSNDIKQIIEQDDVDALREYIARGGNVSIQDGDGVVPLFTALSTNKYNIANLLIDAMPDLAIRDKMGRQAIHYAAIANTPAWLIKKLIAKGADVNSKIDWGWTPLTYAARFASYNSLNYFLSRKDVDVNSQDSTFATALHVAAKYGKDKSIDMLLQHPGIQINLRDVKGNTPLHYAVSEGTIEAARAILRGNPDVNVRNVRGLSALDMARQGNREDLVNLLIAHGADKGAAAITDAKSYESTRVNEAAVELLKASRFEEAKPMLYKAIEMNPNIAAPYFNLYLLTMREHGDLNKADDLLVKAIAIDPHSRLYQQQLGRLRFMQNRKEEAMAIFKKYVSDYPEDQESKALLSEFPQLAK